MGKAQLIKHLAPNKAFIANAPFQKLKISNEFKGNVDQPYRGATDSAPVVKVTRLAGPDKEDYIKYGKDYYAKNGTLDGHMKVATPEGDIGLKSNSRFNKDGTISLKQKTSTAKERERANRVFMMEEQTFGTDDFVKGHHRVELDLVERVLEGMADNDRKRFVKLLNTQFDSITTGNSNKNIIPLPKPIHDLVHMRLREAGLDPKRMNFNGASFKDRLRFMRQVEYILLDIDKLISKGLEDASDLLVAKK